MEVKFDEIDQALLDERIAARHSFDEPLNGDFVIFESGEVERFSHIYDDGDAQTSPLWAGSFYLCASGVASFSGSLNPSILRSTVSSTDEKRDGRFWFFHHDQAGAGRGVQCTVPCRVWRTSAPYNGYLTERF